MTQSKDPHFQRESSKYDNPIPSREFILSFLEERGCPVKFNDLFESLGLSEEDDNVALSRRLRAMERDGQIIRTRRGAYGLPEKMDLVKGRVQGHKDGFGFLILDQGGDDWYLSPKEMQQVFHGDRVLARLKHIDRKGRYEGAVVEVLEGSVEQIVGRYVEESGVGFVRPDDKRQQQDVVIPPENKHGAQSGQVVVARITQRPSRRFQAVGTIVEVLGDHMAPGIEIETAIRTYGIPHEWPDEVRDQVSKLSAEVSEADKQGRRDLRDLPLVTIDGEDAKDFDDAVYCEPKKGGGWRLWVAIADVSHYVRPGTPLDIEAQSRGNSVYFPEHVVPMLPELLSNGLCSLNPKVDRLCMVCEMTISAAGNISNYDFYPAVMHSQARLTYTKVWNILEGDVSLREEYASLVPHLENLYGLFKARLEVRQERGAIEFETTETQILFREDRKIDRIMPVKRNDAHKIIEECMICANVAAARFFLKNKIPGIYRVHEGPPETKLETFRGFLAELGLFLFGGSDPEPGHYQELLSAIRQRPDADVIQIMLLRSMSQAVYSPDNQGHFGLAFKAYTHFTSPIRRYPDLLVHRIIKHQLAKEDASEALNGGASYTMEQLLQLGEHCSQTERTADDATRDVVDWLKCEFMLAHVDQEFEGSVSAVTNFGLFVQLDEIFVEGLIHVTALDNDYYHFDAARQRLIGERTGRAFRLGDRLRIVVSRVNLDDRKIDFDLKEVLTPAPKESRGQTRKALMEQAKKGTGGKAGAGKAGGRTTRAQKGDDKKSTQGRSKKGSEAVAEEGYQKPSRKSRDAAADGKSASRSGSGSGGKPRPKKRANKTKARGSR